MTTRTMAIWWLPLGVICQQKATNTDNQRKLPKRLMISGIADRALVYTKNNIVQNNLFLHQNDIDPITDKAATSKLNRLRVVGKNVRVMGSLMAYCSSVNTKMI